MNRTNKYLHSSVWFVISFTLAAGSSFDKDNASAQIVPDRTLGAESSIVTPNIDLDGILGSRIDGGAIRGANVFHSFQELNVNEGGAVYFANPSGIANILTRITGGNATHIFGVLGVLGNANLFIINPNGIRFGPNARLDLGGSFVASTANSLIFDNGFEFSANNPQSPPLLTVNIPVGLRFRENPGSIINQSRFPSSTGQSLGLRVLLGRNMIFAGGNVEFIGGGLLAPGGQIELGGLAEPGTIALETNNNNMRLRFPEGVARGDVILSQDATVFAAGVGGGNITINSRNLDVSEKSLIATGILSKQGTPDTVAGDIQINATDRVRVDNSIITSNIGEGASGQAGNIFINTGSLNITNAGLVSSVTFGSGNTGNITVRAKDAVFLSGSEDTSSDNIVSSAIITVVNKGAVGNTGNIQITAKSLSITDGASVSTATFAQGDAGNINIQVTDKVFISGAAPTGIHTDSIYPKSGKAGNIEIFVGSLTVQNGAQMTATATGRGDAGNINIQASDRVTFDGQNGSLTGLFTLAFPESTGKAGNINVNGRTIDLTNGAQLTTNSNNQRAAGNIQINAADSVFVSQGGALETFGIGIANSGNVIINAGGTVSLDGVGKRLDNLSTDIKDEFPFLKGLFGATTPSGIFTTLTSVPSLLSTSIGQGGNIEITTGSLSVTNGAFLSTSTLGQGNAGNIIIKAKDSVIFDGYAPISFELVPKEGGLIPVSGRRVSPPSGASSDVGAVGNIVGSGKGGNIVIEARALSVTGGAQLSTLTAGKGDAGNIRIHTFDSVNISKSDPNLAESSGLLSTTEQGAEGKGGEIRIITQNLQISDGAILSARTRSASRGGNINVQANNLKLTDGGQLLTTAFSSGNAGDIVVKVGERITISGSDSTYANRLAKFGQEALINDGAASGILVRSQSNGNQAGDAGKIEVTSDNIRLDERGTLSAATASGEGGNITLRVGNLLQIRRNSQISTTAGTAGGPGSGGNIDIMADFLVGSGNSDITANSFGGKGGVISITANEGIFGINSLSREELQRQLGTDNLADASLEGLTERLLTNDITAVSLQSPALSGVISIISPDANPSKGLVELPITIVDPDSLIAQNPCRRGRGSEFVDVGRGGLPPSPSEAIAGDTIRVGLVEPASQTNSNAAINKVPTNSNAESIVPAQGWVLNEKGEVVLTAYDPTNMENQRQERTSKVCH